MIFLIKASSRKATRKRGSNWGCCYFLLEKKIVKHFVQSHNSPCHRPTVPPYDTYPVSNQKYNCICGYIV
jgi:hypothetical protein